MLKELNQQDFPKIWTALREECAFRQILMPSCYIDDSGNTRLGRALQNQNTLFVEPDVEHVFTPKEIRSLVAHEIRHLYQDRNTLNTSHKREYDSDRAAIESTDYATVLSYVDKAITMMIDKMVPTKILRGFVKAVHETFPGVIAENFYIPLDRWHPSPGSRLYAMRQVAKEKEHDNPSPTMQIRKF